MGGIPKNYSGAYTLKNWKHVVEARKIMKTVLQAFLFGRCPTILKLNDCLMEVVLTVS